MTERLGRRARVGGRRRAPAGRAQHRQPGPGHPTGLRSHVPRVRRGLGGDRGPHARRCPTRSTDVRIALGRGLRARGGRGSSAGPRGGASSARSGEASVSPRPSSRRCVRARESVEGLSPALHAAARRGGRARVGGLRRDGPMAARRLRTDRRRARRRSAPIAIDLWARASLGVPTSISTRPTPGVGTSWSASRPRCAPSAGRRSRVGDAHRRDDRVARDDESTS